MGIKSRLRSRVARRLFSVFIAFIMLFTLGACSSKQGDSNDLLKSVLNNKKTFITESGEAVFLKNYAVGKGDLADTILASPIEYTFVDFDGDKTLEMVINISSNYGAYLILRCSGLDVYGYEFGVRALQSLKTDGSFIGSNGAASNYYCKLTFTDNKATVIYTAIKDSTMNRFELNSNECSIEELNEYINDWNLKDGVDWIKCDMPSENTDVPNNSTTSTTDNFDVVESTPVKKPSSTNSVNINKYLVVDYSGYSGGGEVSVHLDKEQFYLDNISLIKFKDTNSQNAYYQLYGSKLSPIDIFYNYINRVSLDSTSHLSNGDMINLSWKIDDEQISKYFSLDYSYSNETRSVSGLKEPTKFNPMDFIKVSYSGTAPWGSVKIELNQEKISGSSVAERIKRACELSNFTKSDSRIYTPGESITITYNEVDLSNSSELADYIARYGLIPTATTQSYKVSGFSYHPHSISQIDSSVLSDADAFCKEKLASYKEKCKTFELKSLKRVRAYYKTPKQGNTYYSYHEESYKLYVVYEVSIKAQYDCYDADDHYYKDIKYYYVLYCDSFLLDQNNKLSYSPFEMWAGIGGIGETIYKIDGVFTEEWHRPENSVDDYLFVTDGFYALDDVAEKLGGSSDSFSVEKKNY